MQTTLRINDDIYREAKAMAARSGLSLARFIEEALKERIGRSQNGNEVSVDDVSVDDVAERNKILESLLLSTAHFRVGPQPTREELNNSRLEAGRFRARELRTEVLSLTR